MPKTIAITPSWYWPAGVTRVTGVPPYSVGELVVDRFARHRPDQAALVSGDHRLTGVELAEQVGAAAAQIAGVVSPGGCAYLCADSSAEGVLLLLGALAAGVRVRLVAPGAAPSGGAGCAGVALADAAGAATATATGLPVLRLGPGGAPGSPDPSALPCHAAAGAVDGPGGALGGAGPVTAWHSQHSLLATAISLQTFYQAGPGAPWLGAQPLASWEGLAAVLTPLLAGATLVLPAPGESPLEAAAREGVGCAFLPLDTAAALTKDAKREVKSLRGSLQWLLLSTSGLFHPDERRRVGRLFECPALTVFGLAEVGPVFASHPSWYVDESIGIPLTNVHVVPVEPRSLVPIQTLWELVESGLVTVRSAGAMVGYDEACGAADPFRDGRFVTRTMASSDANGMIYLLPD